MNLRSPHSPLRRLMVFGMVLLLSGTACGGGAAHRDARSLDSALALERRPGVATPDSFARSNTDSVTAVTTEPTLTITAQPTAIDLRGDTVRVTLSVRNLPTSSADLWIFTVEAPVPVLSVEQLGAAEKREISMAKEYGVSVATWAFLGHHVTPGGAAPPLAFSAIGLPGIVRYWAERWVAPDTVETPDLPADTSGTPVLPGPWNSASDSGVTVGIVPFPADRSRGALVARMRTLLQQSCAQRWVDDADVCSSLDRSLEQDDSDELLTELDAQRGKHVGELAYLLLAGNVRALPAP